MKEGLKKELRAFMVGMIGLSLIVICSGFMQVAHADTEINATNCGQVLSTYGERYYLTTNIISDYSGDWCIAIANHNIELDCQGNSIDGNFTMYSGIALGDETQFPTVRNCIISNFYFGLAYEGASNISVINNTFINMSYYASSIGYQHDGGIMANNTVNASAGGFQFGAAGGSNYVITGNRFGADVPNALFFSSYSYVNYSVYNNYFPLGIGQIYDDALSPIDYNTTQSSQTNILGISAFGGNYWGVCDDFNNDGFCDTPVTISTNNIDYLPLSLNFTAPTVNYTFVSYMSFQSEYAFGQNGSITTQFILPDGNGNYLPINNGNCVAQIFYPDGSLFVSDSPMTYINGSGGIYRLNFITPYVEGVYVSDSNCSYNQKGIYSGGTFHVSNLTASYDYLTGIIKPQLDAIEFAISVVQGIINSIQTSVLQIFNLTTEINNTVTYINQSLVPNTIYIW